ncbi:NAD(P)/FAD-dependent oxidoreductase [Mycolicibacterium brumae]|uniref:NAD(P)/FAD-dependent oxidoreductase n=1 Tax=Mycolicibacterium brumae TaxID=85968 RepID=UPI000A50E2FE|nr:FAD-dependent oxidoreductase [Mycolicibacterium brumae]MCV7192782.1 FAD-binding oxidoreductase [Mycolicibacterium brumae]UWW08698.1 FAD-binding oxidoreductase [Mycolicibacterium brumae]
MTVGWDDAVADWRGFAALPGDDAADACVVGLGASGLAAIEALADRGLSVIGVDAGRVAAGAAGRNGGFLAAGPAPGLHLAIRRWGNVAVDLYRETLAEIDRLEAQLGSAIIRRVGSIRLAGLPGSATSDDEIRDRETELADCAQQAAALREHGIAVEDYDGTLGRGLYLPDDAATNPALRAVRIALAVSQRAVLHEHTRVRRVQSHCVETDHGTISAEVIVVAVDGRLELVVPELASRVRSARLQMLATRPIEPGRLPCPVVGRWGYDFAQQLPDGRLFIGGGRDRFAESEWTTQTEPTEEVQTYIHELAQRISGGCVEATDRWAASAGFTDGGRPLCALIDEGVVAVGGYSGCGNLIGPIAARAAVRHVLDGVTPPTWCASLP